MADFYSLDKETLLECKKYADVGAKIAEESLENLQEVIASARKKIEIIMHDAQNENGNIQDSPLSTIWQDMKDELKTLGEYGDEEIHRIRQDIDNRRKEMESFSITLFGRTMAGKSTLMEVLTHGDGSSIGKGKQRTTRDVRAYAWNGLKITDVPGIAAFGGDQDEKIAYEAAQKGDLIIFLLTDDHPQPDEADCLERLRKLGKPVLGIMNVKISDAYSDALLEKRINERFQSGELEQLLRQFYEFGCARGQEWGNIQFVPVHLLCAFNAQRETDGNKRDLYNKLSHFSDVTKYITDCVKIKGNIIRLKTFIDIASKPIMDLKIRMEEYVAKAQRNEESLKDSAASFRERGNGFLSEMRIEIECFLDTQKKAMRASIGSFVEDNYQQDNETIEKKFKSLLKNQEVESKIRAFIDQKQKQLNRLFQDSLKSFMRSYQFVGNWNVELKKYEGGELWNTKRWLERLSSISNIGLIVGGPWGIAVAVAGLVIPFLSDDIEERKQKQKQKLREELEPKCKELIHQTEKLLRDFHFGVAGHIDEIKAETDMLSNTSYKLLTINQGEVIQRLYEISCALNKN